MKKPAALLLTVAFLLAGCSEDPVVVSEPVVAPVTEIVNTFTSLADSSTLVDIADQINSLVMLNVDPLEPNGFKEGILISSEPSFYCYLLQFEDENSAESFDPSFDTTLQSYACYQGNKALLIMYQEELS